MFCTSNEFENEFENDIIKMIKEDVIKMDEIEIRKLYSIWNKGFESETISSPETFVNKKSIISNKQEVPDGAYLKGIDFPTWFGTYNKRDKNTDPSKKNIMIVGIDPLRNENNF